MGRKKKKNDLVRSKTNVNSNRFQELEESDEEDDTTITTTTTWSTIDDIDDEKEHKKEGCPMFDSINSMSVACKPCKHVVAKFCNAPVFATKENKTKCVNDKAKEMLENFNQKHSLCTSEILQK